MQVKMRIKGLKTNETSFKNAQNENQTEDTGQNLGYDSCYIQARAMRRRLQESHSSPQLQSKPLYLANAPFYAESEYVTRDSKVFKMLKQKVLKQQEEAKAREDHLLQRQLALEETVRQQSEDIKRLMALVQQQQQQPKPNP